MATEIQYQSQLPQLLSQLLGSKQTTSSTSNANTTPLEQLFTSAMGASQAGVPEMQQLIASIFQEGATKVPELSQAFANATGARTTGNSSLALSLGDLNRKLSTDAAVAILNNQNTNRQTAGQAASGIAQATRGNSQTQTTKAGVNPLLLALGGSAINKLDKMKGLDWLKSSNAASVMAPVFDGVSTPVDAIIPDAFPEFSQPFADFGGLDASMFGDGISDGLNFDLGFDAFPEFSQPFADFGTLDASMFGDGMSDGLNFDEFFADGGMVGRRGMMRPRGYADGGAVTPQQRNRNYLGTPTRQLPQVRASNFSQARRQQRAPGTNAVDNSEFSGAGPATSVPGTVGTVAENEAAILGFVTAMMAPLIGIPGLATLANTVTGGKSLPSMALSNLLSVTGVTNNSAGNGGMSNNAAPTTATVSVGEGFADDADVDAPSAPGTVGSVSESIGPSDGSGTGPGGSSASGSGVGADGSATSGADGDSGVGSTGAYANGGKVRGPGTGTSDSIPARLSAGEYVIPADVVRRIGTDTLDRLMLGHMPAGIEMEDEDD